MVLTVVFLPQDSKRSLHVVALDAAEPAPPLESFLEVHCCCFRAFMGDLSGRSEYGTSYSIFKYTTRSDRLELEGSNIHRVVDLLNFRAHRVAFDPFSGQALTCSIAWSHPNWKAKLNQCDEIEGLTNVGP
jgi:hypothetical protein